MLALYLAIMATAYLVSGDAEPYNTRVHSSVVFTRTGERTPYLMNGTQSLTSLGAQQLFSVGEAFRNRYIADNTGNDNNTSPLSINRIMGLSSHNIEWDQLTVEAVDRQYHVASALAFLQGFYPPYTLDKEAAVMLDPSSVLANSSYIEYPLSGYQYPFVEALSVMDPSNIFLAGEDNCIAWTDSVEEYFETDEYIANDQANIEMYTDVGLTTLKGVLSPPEW
jgi:hypothetical protein